MPIGKHNIKIIFVFISGVFVSASAGYFGPCSDLNAPPSSPWKTLILLVIYCGYRVGTLYYYYVWVHEKLLASCVIHHFHLYLGYIYVVHHHVPRVSVQAVSPSVVTL